MSVSTLECLKKAGFDFFVARVWESIGDYDRTGWQNVKVSAQSVNESLAYSQIRTERARRWFLARRRLHLPVSSIELRVAR